MLIALRRGAILLSSIVYLSSALQVTPGSPCSAVCIDDPKADIKDPSNSNTFITDIVCQDGDYTGTEAGRNFKACQTCLQTSDASAAGESDQGWFICMLSVYSDME